MHTRARTEDPVRWPLGKRLKAKLHRLVHTRLWRIDIHPTASIDPTALIDRTWPMGVHIGPGCRIGEEAVVLTHDMTRGLYLDTIIGADTWVGPRAIILPGVTVGDGCLIMPGALVRTDMPNRTVAIGNPAEIRPRQD